MGRTHSPSCIYTLLTPSDLTPDSQTNNSWITAHDAFLFFFSFLFAFFLIPKLVLFCPLHISISLYLEGWAFYGPIVRGHFAKRTGNIQPLLANPWYCRFKCHISIQHYISDNRSHLCLVLREQIKGEKENKRSKIN